MKNNIITLTILAFLSGIGVGIVIDSAYVDLTRNEVVAAKSNNPNEPEEFAIVISREDPAGANDEPNEPECDVYLKTQQEVISSIETEPYESYFTLSQKVRTLDIDGAEISRGGENKLICNVSSNELWRRLYNCLEGEESTGGVRIKFADF